MTDQTDKQNINLTSKVLFYGRTLQEYIKMFDLDLSLWKGCKILDCSSGPASFVAEANELDLDVVGCDPLYTDELENLLECGEQDINTIIDFLLSSSLPISQKFYTSVDDMKDYATSALRKFLVDYPVGKSEKRYIQAGLPNLPFEDKTFDLVLSSNFLFVYSKLFIPNLETLDYQFHLRSVLELIRVAKREVRIFPMLYIDGKLHEYAENLLADLKKEDIVADIRPVEYGSAGKDNIQDNLILCITRAEG